MVNTHAPNSTQTRLSESVQSELERLISAINQAYPELADPFDADWRSPCECGEPRSIRSANQAASETVTPAALEVPWRPLLRTDPGRLDLFAPLERALEIAIHPDILTYYCSYYSGGLEADCTAAGEGPVSLIQLWNDDDADRLIENLLGHSMAKARAKAPFSVFFACTEVDSEMFLSVENHTGHVLLERPGYKSERTVASSLGEFLATLTPAPPERHPERAAYLSMHSASTPPGTGNGSTMRS